MGNNGPMSEVPLGPVGGAGDPVVRPAGGQAVLERPLEQSQAQTPWQVVVWDDPVNLMSYVTHVFMTYFKFSRSRSEHLMMLVHNEGRATVATGEREEMERHVVALHGYGLLATLEEPS